MIFINFCFNCFSLKRIALCS